MHRGFRALDLRGVVGCMHIKDLQGFKKALDPKLSMVARLKWFVSYCQHTLGHDMSVRVMRSDPSDLWEVRMLPACLYAWLPAYLLTHPSYPA